MDRSHFIFLAAILGSYACMKLNQLVEAIRWCDEGLAVSFDNTFPTTSIFFHFKESLKPESIKRKE